MRQCRVVVMCIIALLQSALMGFQVMRAKLGRAVKDPQRTIHDLPAIKRLFYPKNTAMALAAAISR